jgi:hypothetical protein
VKTIEIDKVANGFIVRPANNFSATTRPGEMPGEDIKVFSTIGALTRFIKEHFKDEAIDEN